MRIVLAFFIAISNIAMPASAGQQPATAAPATAAAAREMFAVSVTGTGDPMILIPGLISSGEVWKGTVAHYASRYQCHVLTLAGFAGQPASGATPFLPAVRDAIAQYIRDRKLQRPVIVGHSLGGFLALSIASAYPDLVGQLVVVDGLPAPGADSRPDATPEELKAMAERFSASYAKTDAAARRKMIETMARNPEHVDLIASWDAASDRATAVKAVSEIVTSDVRRDLAKVQTPALILLSVDDGRPRDEADRLYRAQFTHMKRWQLALAPPGARHFIMLDEPGWLFERMDAFLSTP